MTNKEVIRILNVIKEHPSMEVYLPDEYEALDIAIKALKHIDLIKFNIHALNILIEEVEENEKTT